MPTTPAPPFANYGMLTGQLFLYGQGRAAFESPAPKTPNNGWMGRLLKSTPDFCANKLILLGGLSDGLIPTPYTGELERVCIEHDWSLVQPVLSSSYTGFGHGSLERDCTELQELIQYLSEFRNGQQFALVGHSTGCQDAVYFLRHAKPSCRAKMRLVVLQAPVSDREGAQDQDPKLQEKLGFAETLVQAGKGQEMVPRDFFWAPMTAQRFVDLHEKGGSDDFFSSDWSDEELQDLLSHVGDSAHNDGATDATEGGNATPVTERKGIAILVAFSGADEYVPDHVDKRALTERLVGAMNAKCPEDKTVAHALYLPTGNHNLSQSPKDAKAFINKVSEMLSGNS